MFTLKDTPHQFASFFSGDPLQGVAYLLYKKLLEGHICLDEQMLSQEILPAELAIPELEEIFKSKLLSRTAEERNLFVYHQNRFYIQRYFHYETQILEKIQILTTTDPIVLDQRIAKLQYHQAYLDELFPDQTGKIDWQQIAAISSVLNNFTIITGGPGTGKTTTVAKCLKILLQTSPDLRVALTAPTGKAANRLGESLKEALGGPDCANESLIDTLVPMTIHRLLGSMPGSHHFRHNSQNPLEVDLVIVDESSMIDVALFAKLLDAIAPNARLILLGDRNQLASVEAGSLFGDLCQGSLNHFSPERAAILSSLCGVPLQTDGSTTADLNGLQPLINHRIELHYSHRFKQDGGIGVFSAAILSNDEATIEAVFNSQYAQEISFSDGEGDVSLSAFISGYREYIEEKDIAQSKKI